MHTIQLPSSLKGNALEILMPMLNRANEEDEILLDFGKVKFYYPTATVAILARCWHWKQLGKKLSATNHNHCPASNYLKRIDFFGELGLKLDEPFQRHNTNARFVTVRRIRRGKDVDRIAREVAKCMAHGSHEVEEVIRYAVGEIITNIVQHSAGEGFLAAQRYPGSSSVYFAVADSGIGLRKSFAGTALESELTTPLLALEKSMEPLVSSALLRPLNGPYDEYVNKGIGLSMVNEITRRTYGRMDVLTENAHFKRVGDTSVEFRENNTITNQGVLVSMHIQTDEIDNFEEIITKVRNTVNPIKLDDWGIMFE
jgi:hypothetical protein